jgi:hypothetical protein
VRRRAHPQPCSTPAQTGHPSPPEDNACSTFEESASTINTGCLQAPSDGPPISAKRQGGPSR